MRWAATAVLTLPVLALSAAPASAHGLVGRADLPIPEWLFTWGAVMVLVVSFVALAAMWREPRLQRDSWRPLPTRISRVLTSRVVDVTCGAIGLGLLALVTYTGAFGSRIVSENFAPTFVYVGFWLGLLLLSVLFGDVFRVFNPWRAGGRLLGWLLGPHRSKPMPYPERLGYWPAVIGLIAFAWLEIGSASGDEPATIAAATIFYSGVTWAAMAAYGVETWSDRGETFSVYFGFFARMSIFERRERTIGIRPPLSGLPAIPMLPGLVAFVIVMIGTVSFDGFSGGATWQSILGPLLNSSAAAGMEPRSRLEAAYAVALAVVLVLVYGFYRLGIEGAHGVDRRHSRRALARGWAHSLVPIAFAYAAAHYVSLLLFQGQALAPLASDPLGRDWDLFGTATWSIDYGFIRADPFWYMQVALVIVGHLAALALAHDKALAVYDDTGRATRSQLWMLTVMAGFTTLALWLLSAANQG